MQSDPPEPYRPIHPAPLRLLAPFLPPYCRAEILDILQDQYDCWEESSGRATAMMCLHREIAGILIRLRSLWLHQYWLNHHGPMHWQVIRIARVALKRSGVWYWAGEAMRSAGQPVQTLRLIVYDPRCDAFLATRTREVRAGLMPPQAALALGSSGIAADQVSETAARILAAMTDQPAEYWSAQHPESSTGAYQYGRGGFQCRTLVLTLAGDWSDRRLRPIIKGPSVFVPSADFLAAIADDDVYARVSRVYRVRQRRAYRKRIRVCLKLFPN